MNTKLPKQRLGIFGGTFDPIHLGHLLVANTAWEELALDEFMFMPAGQPWMKEERVLAAAEDRLAMVQLAIGVSTRFEVSRMEVDRGEVNYTVDTLVELHRQHPGVELVLVLGADALLDLPCWREPERILQLARVAVAPRPGYGNPELGRDSALLTRLPALQERANVLRGPRVDISATDLRARVREGRSIRYLVPEAVEAYIRWRGLYTASA